MLEVEDPAISRDLKIRDGFELLQNKDEDSSNPYEHRPETRKGHTGRRDLRKLSEHIKLMREVEERKKRGDKED